MLYPVVNWIKSLFRKPEPQQARIPHADEEGDRQRRVLVLRSNMVQIKKAIQLAVERKQKRLHLYRERDAIRQELIRLGDEA